MSQVKATESPTRPLETQLRVREVRGESVARTVLEPC
ncbi:hypothetical protein HALLA_12305 [Halostagnicola larsenii XH-48]|uniref:Uncharacterized protein n=1 Tax=Halostagnicola larsenii XH-48 TaxID=797299 RepID=W0JVC2_9EURY|nr:hypothetical protein HALLA_12305 [Halostagnicola larsenii XH-48]